MTERNEDIPKISLANTKKEMLDAFNRLKQKLQEDAKAELKPEKTKEIKKDKEIVQSADIITSDNAVKKVDNLKAEIVTALSEISNKLEEETERYNKIKEAMEVKNKELKEIFEIEKSAFALAALLEAEKQQKIEFEEEMAQRKRHLEDEMNDTKAEWQKEKKTYREKLDEEKKEDEKIRQRGREEFEYRFNREQEQKKGKLADELERLKKGLNDKKEEFEKEVTEKENDLLQRDLAISEREKIMKDLQSRVDAFPKELEDKVNEAVKVTTDSLKAEARKNEELIKKGFEGEKNVLSTRIESLEQVVDVQKNQIETLSKQIENAYGKVQDIAIKAVSSFQDRNLPVPDHKHASAESEKS